jgi:hypothetical protein
MKPTGPIDARVMIISDFPTQVEKLKGEFLSTGREGVLLDKLLQRADLPLVEMIALLSLHDRVCKSAKEIRQRSRS